MNAIPYGVVKARRTTGGILLLSSLATVVAAVLAIGTWFIAAPEVNPIVPGSGGTAIGSVPTPAPVNPSGVVPAPTPEEQLADLRASDAAVVANIPDGYWVPQLASNRPGTDRDGNVWDAATILQDHLYWRSYGGALLWSGDFMTYNSSDYWVTVVPSSASSTSDDVLAWCVSQNIGRNNCLAKRISTNYPHTGDNTRSGP